MGSVKCKDVSKNNNWSKLEDSYTLCYDLLELGDDEIITESKPYFLAKLHMSIKTFQLPHQLLLFMNPKIRIDFKFSQLKKQLDTLFSKCTYDVDNWMPLKLRLIS